MRGGGGGGIRRKGGYVLLVIAWQVGLSVSQVTGGCKKIGACSCQSDDGVVDLSALAGDGNPTFKDLTTSTVSAWKFSWNPCKSYSFGKCVNVASCKCSQCTLGCTNARVSGCRVGDVCTQTCEYSNDGYGFYNLGTQESARFTADSGQLLLLYNATEQGTFRGTQVTLICDPKTEKSFELLPVSSPIAEFTLTSRYCCPQPGSTGLSAGSVCVIVFAGLVFVYAVAGVVFQVSIRQASGMDVVPNYAFWSSLPGLIKDGATFAVSCGRAQYSKI